MMPSIPHLSAYLRPSTSSVGSSKCAQSWPQSSLCQMTSFFSLFVKMLDLQSTDDVFLSEQRQHECRHQGHHGRGAHQIPLQTHLAHELRHHHGDDRRLLPGEDEGKQEFVPGKQPAQY